MSRNPDARAEESPGEGVTAGTQANETAGRSRIVAGDVVEEVAEVLLGRRSKTCGTTPLSTASPRRPRRSCRGSRRRRKNSGRAAARSTDARSGARLASCGEEDFHRYEPAVERVDAKPQLLERRRAEEDGARRGAHEHRGRGPAPFALHFDLGDRPLLDAAVGEAHGLHAMRDRAWLFEKRARHHRVAGARIHQCLEPARLALRTRMQRDDHPELAHRTLLEQTAEWPSTSRSRYSGAGSRFFSPSGLGLCENSSRREGIERGSRRALAPEFFFRRSSCRGGPRHAAILSSPDHRRRPAEDSARSGPEARSRGCPVSRGISEGTHPRGALALARRAGGEVSRASAGGRAHRSLLRLPGGGNQPRVPVLALLWVSRGPRARWRIGSVGSAWLSDEAIGSREGSFRKMSASGSQAGASPRYPPDPGGRHGRGDRSRRPDDLRRLRLRLPGAAVLRALRDLRDHGRLRRGLLAGRRPTPGLDRGSQRRGPVRRAGDARRADDDRVGARLPGYDRAPAR